MSLILYVDIPTYDGCTRTSCFQNGTNSSEWVLPVKCPSETSKTTVTETKTVYAPTYQVITTSTTVVDYDTTRKYFDQSALSQSIMYATYSALKIHFRFISLRIDMSLLPLFIFFLSFVTVGIKRRFAIGWSVRIIPNLLF